MVSVKAGILATLGIVVYIVAALLLTRFHRPLILLSLIHIFFELIRKEQEKRELQNLKALIYFTDGDGIYPRQKPDYETAFVFVKKTENMRLVPDWAYKLVIGERTKI